MQYVFSLHTVLHLCKNVCRTHYTVKAQYNEQLVITYITGIPFRLLT